MPSTIVNKYETIDAKKKKFDVFNVCYFDISIELSKSMLHSGGLSRFALCNTRLLCGVEKKNEYTITRYSVWNPLPINLFEF